MPRVLSSLCLLLLFSLPASAQQAAVTPRIDLYTMGPGDDLFSRFGHAAICVSDPQAPWGRCYNYGTADFSTPLPLTWNFLRGRALFWVSVQDLPDMVRSYRIQDRTLYRQRLPLSPQQAQRMAAALVLATAEQVRYYRYHHFRDNCATRLRDLIDIFVRSGPARLRRDPDPPQGPSYRDFARRGFQSSPALLGLTDLVLGRAADGPTTVWQAMFLPEVMRAEVAQRLHAPPEVLYERQAPVPAGSLSAGRHGLILGGGLLGILVLLSSLLGRRAFRVALGMVGLLLGLLGTLLCALFLVSPLPELRSNQALLVFLPTDLLLLALPPRKLKSYLQVRTVQLGLVVLGAALGILIQPLWAPLCLAGLPLMAALLLSADATGPAPSPGAIPCQRAAPRPPRSAPGTGDRTARTSDDQVAYR